MKLAITGATGSLGSALIAELARGDRASRVVALSRDEVKSGDLADRFAAYAPLKCVLGDVRDERRLEEVFRGCTTVVHAAALKRITHSVYSPEEIVKTNVQGTINVIRAATEVGVRRVVVVSSDKACVASWTPVVMEDGHHLAIAPIVRYKLPVRVRSLGPDGLVARDVTGWYRNARDGRAMFRLTYEGATARRDKRTGVLLTGDHRVLTADGWKEAARIANGELLVTAEPSPNPRQAALIVGTLLGDSSLIKGHVSVRAAFRMGHAADQREWLETKRRALEEFEFSHGLRDPRGARRQEFLWACSRASRIWEQYHAVFYTRTRRKRPPRILITQALAAAPEVLLASWYLDDGCMVRPKGCARPSARLATHGFDPADVEWLVEQLNALGLKCSAYRWRQGYREIRFGVEGAAELFRRIARAVPPSMRYKLPDNAEPYDESFWNLGKAEQMLAPAIVEPVEYKGEDVYCLGVAETENFISGGLILHNCQPTNLYGMSKAVAECYAVQSNSYAWPRGTTVACIRYGNVLGSRGSVIGVWREQLRRGEPLTLTDAQMTRFIITLPQAVAFVLRAIETMEGGEIFVPRLPSARLPVLADAVEAEWRDRVGVVMGMPLTTLPATRHVTGLRPGGEKLHEVLISHEEPARTWVCPDGGGFVILPSYHSWRERWDAPGGLRLAAPYSSDAPAEWLGHDELVAMLREVP